MNNAILIGRLTKDLDFRLTPGAGKQVATGTIAVNRDFKNKEGKYDADFINIEIWGKQAENACNYTSKGSLVGIQGSIRNEMYEKDGQKRYITKVVVNKLQFLESKKDGQGKSSSFEPTGLDPEGFAALDDDSIPF